MSRYIDEDKYDKLFYIGAFAALITICISMLGIVAYLIMNMFVE